jgi:hypothetical protein
MIKCRALDEKSIFVTSNGDILPCCYMYDGGPTLTQEIREAIKSPNFKTITDSWNTDKPFTPCHRLCDDRTTTSPSNMIHFDNQWKNASTPTQR